jgi:hypothetical protein
MRLQTTVFAGLCMLLAGVIPAAAEYPEKPITLIRLR